MIECAAVLKEDVVPARRPTRRPRPSRRRVGPVIPKTVKPTGKPFIVICGECYEEVVFEPREGVKEIYCGECDHGAHAPSEEWLRRWTYYKGLETKYGVLGALCAVAIVVVAVVWTLLLTYPENWEWNTLNYVFAAVEGALLVAVCYFGYMHERNRYEAYF